MPAFLPIVRRGTFRLFLALTGCVLAPWAPAAASELELLPWRPTVTASALDDSGAWLLAEEQSARTSWRLLSLGAGGLTAMEGDVPAHTWLALLSLGAAAAVGLGAFGSRWIAGQPLARGALQTLGGTVLGALPGHLALMFTPLRPHMGLLYAVAGTVYLAPLWITSSALGSWGAGQLLGEGRRSGMAALGALGGAVLGALVGYAFDLAVRAVYGFPMTDFRPPYGWLVGAGAALAMPAVGATLGYQWAGGAPRG